MAPGRIRVGVAGATGAVGTEILALLGRRGSPVSEVVPMASPDSDTPYVEFAGRQVPVRNLHAEALAECDAVFVAVPRAVAAVHLRDLLDSGAAVIDLSGALGPEAPRVVVGVNREALDRFPEDRAVACPSPLVTTLATLLHPLRARVGHLRCRGLALQPASVRGRAGVEALSRQVVALFNSRTPEPSVFPHGLAFDVAPLVGSPGPQGWTDAEADAAGEVAAIVGLDPDDLAITQVVAPWFNGICLSLHVETEPALGAVRAAEALSDAPHVVLARGDDDLPRPRGVDGHLGVHVGRLRDDPSGQGVHLWAAADALRWGAAGNAVAVLKALLEDGRIG